MKIIECILDAIFPPRDSELIIRGVTDTTIKALYHLERAPECLSLSPYKHPTIRALITENKFHGNQHAAKMLFRLVEEWHEKQNGSLIFIPVPLGAKRKRERGYNQIAEVLKYFNEKNASLVRLDLCSRPKETSPQLSLPRRQRLHNVSGAFVGNTSSLCALRDMVLVVVDDVCTTGATMRAVRSELVPHLHSSCKIICVALAH
jgi:predicted amidophosphoribosyltransferase